MNVYFTRDSVCAGDDGDAPHAREIQVPDDGSIDHVVQAMLAVVKLPQITGGSASWAVSSNIPLAVVAQEWPAARFLFRIPPAWKTLDFDGQTLRFHFSYFAQQNPETVYAVLSRLQVRAE